MKTKPKPIYSIATIYLTETEKFHSKKNKMVADVDWTAWKDANVGFFYQLPKAKKCVDSNWGSLDECGYYNYLVIQRTYEGLYNIRGLSMGGKLEWWYKLNPRRSQKVKTWIPCEKPKLLKHMVNFA